jgi:hypothetical protein
MKSDSLLYYILTRTIQSFDHNVTELHLLSQKEFIEHFILSKGMYVVIDDIHGSFFSIIFVFLRESIRYFKKVCQRNYVVVFFCLIVNPGQLQSTGNFVNIRQKMYYIEGCP